MITVFGSYNFDVTMRLDGLAPLGAIAVVDRHEVCPGGKGGNQAVAFARAGHPPRCFGCVGDDALGTYLLEKLGAEGVVTDGIVRSRESATGMGLIFLNSGGDHHVVYAKGGNAVAAASSVPDDAIESAELLVLQGDVDMRENVALITRASGRTPVMLTLGPFSPIPLAALDNVGYLVMNQREASEFAEYCRSEGTRGIPPPGGPHELCQWIHATFGCAAVITLGDEGAAACDHNGVYRVPAIDIKLVDSVGAGDAFAGHFGAAIAAGRPFPEALFRGVVAGGLSCERVGAQSAIPTAAEVDEVIARLGYPASGLRLPDAGT